MSDVESLTEDNHSNHAGPVQCVCLCVCVCMCVSLCVCVSLGGKCFHMCPNKVCVPKSSVCDGVLDCRDRSDELNCSKASEWDLSCLCGYGVDIIVHISLEPPLLSLYVACG